MLGCVNGMLREQEHYKVQESSHNTSVGGDDPMMTFKGLVQHFKKTEGLSDDEAILKAEVVRKTAIENENGDQKWVWFKYEEDHYRLCTRKVSDTVSDRNTMGSRQTSGLHPNPEATGSNDENQAQRSQAQVQDGGVLKRPRMTPHPSPLKGKGAAAQAAKAAAQQGADADVAAAAEKKRKEAEKKRKEAEAKKKRDLESGATVLTDAWNTAKKLCTAVDETSLDSEMMLSDMKTKPEWQFDAALSEYKPLKQLRQKLRDQITMNPLFGDIVKSKNLQELMKNTKAPHSMGPLRLGVAPASMCTWRKLIYSWDISYLRL